MDTSTTLATPALLAPPVAAKTRLDRVESIDLLRGVVMVVMALDHVRDFFSEQLLMDPTDLNTTTVGIFLTRWITHFCAPTFIFLAGTSAFLSGTRGKSVPALSRFLLTRGLWLAFFEVVINRMMWMFNYDLQHHGAGVFWAIGWSMVVLSVLVYLPTWLVTGIGVWTILLHNLLDGLTADQVALPRWLWVILHSPGEENAPLMQKAQFSENKRAKRSFCAGETRRGRSTRQDCAGRTISAVNGPQHALLMAIRLARGQPPALPSGPGAGGPWRWRLASVASCGRRPSRRRGRRGRPQRQSARRWPCVAGARRRAGLGDGGLRVSRAADDGRTVGEDGAAVVLSCQCARRRPCVAGAKGTTPRTSTCLGARLATGVGRGTLPRARNALEKCRFCFSKATFW
jgi:Heparan-alpha-glucosaminide N-acetyltransferase, catalytic